MARRKKSRKKTRKTSRKTGGEVKRLKTKLSKISRLAKT